MPNKALIHARLEHKWTQKELAEHVGTTTINVSRWERGITCPNSHFRYQLCLLFDRNEEELGLVPSRFLRKDDASSGLEENQETVPDSLHSHPEIWYVPFQRNPLFTGRDDLLASIHQMFHYTENASRPRPSCVLYGLGGVGKTQIALEYVYRYQQSYQAVVWIDASTQATIAASTASIGALLPYPKKEDQPAASSVEDIKTWLQKYTGWLLILDNVEDMEVISPLLSISHQNRILLTSPTKITGMTVSCIDIDEMNETEGTLLLLRRARYIDSHASLEDAPVSFCTQAEEIVRAMGGLPLALDQVGAYIEETGCSLPAFLALYRSQDFTILSQRGKALTDHPASVTFTLLRAIEKVVEANAVAARLLHICALLNASTISEEAVLDNYLSETYDQLIFDAAIAALRTSSLVRRNVEARTLTIHPILRVVLREWHVQTEQRDHYSSLTDQYALDVGPRIAQERSSESLARLAPEKEGSTSLSTRRPETPSRERDQPSLLNRPGRFSSRLIQPFTPPKRGLLIIVSWVVLVSILVLFLFPLVEPTKNQLLSNSLAEETNLEAHYFQKESIGLSDGKYIFDTYPGRTDSSLKSQAAACLQQNNTSCAVSFMTQAISDDVTDGEMQIYNEDLHVSQSGAPFVSVVLGIAISGDATYLLRARSIMQAAFLAQHEINTQGLLPNGLRLRILIANSGSNDANVATTAQFIANRIREGNPDHIVAVVGWPFSSETLDALDVVTGAGVPMISQTASSTSLSGSSPYFFRVNPTDSQQGQALADVAVNQLHAKNILLLQDPTDPYSVSLANAFSERVSSLNASVLYGPENNFTIGVTTSQAYEQSVVKEAEEKRADLIFMAGFDVDAIRLAHALGDASRAAPGDAFLANLKIMSGDAVATGLPLGFGGGPDAQTGTDFPQDMRRLIFSSFAYQGEWSFQKIPASQQPQFFSDWTNTYKNLSVNTLGTPGPDSHAIMTYDAVQVIVKALALMRASSVTGQTVRAGLAALGKGNIPSFQGVSGVIAFDNEGNPVNKAFVILDIENVHGENQMVIKQVFGLLHN